MIKEFTKEDDNGCKMDVFMKDGSSFFGCDMISFVSTAFSPSDRLIAFWPCSSESICMVPLADVKEIHIYKAKDKQS